MSTSTPSVPKVRTYAADLDLMRSGTDHPKVPVAAPKPVVDTSPQQVIPPFHTFSKSEGTLPSGNTTTSSAGRPTAMPDAQKETQRILADTSARSVGGDLKEGMPAVIITDTKRKRFKL
jgi:hypothetical protein